LAAAVPVEHALRDEQVRLVPLAPLSKLNAAVLLKAMGDLGATGFAQLMRTNYQNQFAIDELLKIITIELEPLNLDFLINSYHNITRTLLPNEIVPDFGNSSPMQKSPSIGRYDSSSVIRCSPTSPLLTSRRS
jgi:hypothetical protein